MSRRARKRRTVTKSIAAIGKKSSKFDGAPSKGDISVVSSTKRKYAGVDEFEQEAPEIAQVHPEPVTAGPGSVSKQKHAALRAAGLERARKLKAIRAELNLPEPVVKQIPTQQLTKPIPAELSNPLSKPSKKPKVVKQIPLRSENIRAKRRARDQRLKESKKTIKDDSDSDAVVDFHKPKFGEVIDRPSERINELGKALASKFTPAVAAKLRKAI